MVVVFTMRQGSVFLLLAIILAFFTTETGKYFTNVVNILCKTVIFYFVSKLIIIVMT